MKLIFNNFKNLKRSLLITLLLSIVLLSTISSLSTAKSTKNKRNKDDSNYNDVFQSFNQDFKHMDFDENNSSETDSNENKRVTINSSSSFVNPFKTKKETTTNIKLGEGSFGTAYLVSDKKKVKENYVVKKIITNSKEERDMAEREIKYMTDLKDCGIVQIYGSKIDQNDNYYIKQEYCEGGDLFDLLASYVNKKNKFTNQDRIEIQKELITNMKIIAKQLQCMHDKNFLHMDLKTDNVFMCNGKPKIADFGLSILEKYNKVQKRKFLFFKKEVMELERKHPKEENKEKLKNYKQLEHAHNDIASGKYSKGVDIFALHILALDFLKLGQYTEKESQSLRNSNPNISLPVGFPFRKQWNKLNGKALKSNSKKIISLDDYVKALDNIEQAITNNGNKNRSKGKSNLKKDNKSNFEGVSSLFGSKSSSSDINDLNL